MDFRYDVIVVGAGHAGCEAASAAARMGSKTMLITMDMNKIAQMSCNPAVGGIAKGQIVREIDALGGQMGIVTDRSAIQYRLLNQSKGPAMWSPRSQSDRKRFIEEWVKVLSHTENLNIWQDIVTGLIIKDNKVCGVKTALGIEMKAEAVVLTNGTFLNGLMHCGKTQIAGGRISEPASYGITEQLVELGFRSDRMKTGTPARIDARSIHFDEMVRQDGDNDWHQFSYLDTVKKGVETNALLDHLYESPNARSATCRIGRFSPFQRSNQEYRSPLLPEYRDKDCYVCRKRRASTFPGTGGSRQQ